ncbi:hypothetical protein [Auritidibacter ignavus]|uniref:hypothetical protein n=1 Tax=Auritidibacter ignavus TaxID=678932 RepID=UPI0024BA6B09|nr:hypothetical protein [Auritidibacter ignavus]WHS35098.1 hypothetical protein QM403_00590 [Auritidibacter ignavus]
MQKVRRALKKTPKVTLLIGAVYLLGGAFLVLSLLVRLDFLSALGVLLILPAGLLVLFRVGRPLGINKSVLRNVVSEELANAKVLMRRGADATLDRRSLRERLSLIGSFTPEVKDTSAKGRHAAAVSDDPDRQFRLYAALYGQSGHFSGDVTNSSRRRVGIITTTKLKDRLDLVGDFELAYLQPGVIEAQVESFLPTALVIEEDALHHGQWFPCLQAEGTALLQDLLKVMRSLRDKKVPVYILSSKAPHLASFVLRENSDVVIRGNIDPTEATGALSKTLMDYYVDAELSHNQGEQNGTRSGKVTRQ